MIDGLKLTLPGDRLRAMLDRRIRWHVARADSYARELERPGEQADAALRLLPEHILEHERDDHADRADMLKLIQAHIVPEETYLLGERDLRFGDLLPDAADW